MLNKLTDRVYYLDYVERGDRPTLGLIAGDSCSLVVDGGNSKAHMEEFMSDVSLLDVPEPKYLVLTHWHWDHVFGMAHAGLINIAQRMTAQMVDWMRELRWTDEAIESRVRRGLDIEFCRHNIMLEMPGSSRRITVGCCDIVFEDNLSLNLGGLTVNVKHVLSDHSPDCCVVHVPGERVVFTGDALYMNMQQNKWRYTTDKLLPLLDYLESLEGTHYIHSHHPGDSRDGFAGMAAYYRSICRAAGQMTSKYEAIANYELNTGRKCSDVERKDLIAFVNGNVIVDPDLTYDDIRDQR